MKHHDMEQDFEFFLGPVMHGPSSSHTAAPCKAALEAFNLLGVPPRFAYFGLGESFVKTGRGHLTDLALLAGCLGIHADDPNLHHSFDIAKNQGLVSKFEAIRDSKQHPNTLVICLWSSSENSVRLVVESIGGGAIRVLQKEK